MKWYMCISESSLGRDMHEWKELILGALRSAAEKTSLNPIVLYDGLPGDFTRTLEQHGAKVIHHRVSVYDDLVRRDEIQPGYLPIASGAFLRIDIPVIESDDEYVLYTDCDVIFLRDLDLGSIKPRYFACAPQTSRTDFANDANSGVLLINVSSMRQTHAKFCDFIVENLNAGWPGCDQENYRRFYRGKHEPLPLAMNWKPYWGLDPNASILHWHGPKPDAVARMLGGARRGMPPAWLQLFDRSAAGYRKFIEESDIYYNNVYMPKIGVAEDGCIVGHIDKISGNSVAGWFLNPGKLEEAVSLKVSLNGSEFINLKCDSFRPDLKKIYGADIGGFSFVAAAPNNVKSLQFLSQHGNVLPVGYKGLTVSQITV